MNQLAHLQNALSDRYRVERQIGVGGMATVFLARDPRHDRNVALKLLKPEPGAVLGVERFLSEIRVTANLQHPHLLPLFDSGEADGLLFYVMPYVEGESLRGRLDREKSDLDCHLCASLHPRRFNCFPGPCRLLEGFVAFPIHSRGTGLTSPGSLSLRRGSGAVPTDEAQCDAAPTVTHQ